MIEERGEKDEQSDIGYNGGRNREQIRRGIKQLAPIGPNGEIIMDYSVYDAIEAGFDKVVFVIRKDLEKDFKEVIGNRIAQKVEVAYAYQEVSDIPAEYAEKFVGRTKPWGTGQAILCCKMLFLNRFL